MGSDNLFLKSRQERQKRRVEVENQRANDYLIVTEGTKTEPNYFEGLIQDLKNRYPNLNLNFRIEGKGMNTVSLVNSADELQIYIDKCKQKVIPYAETFVVFDKDSFSDNEFNKAIDMCHKSGFVPLWSNQAIEYWFLLHFNKDEGKINRSDYSDKLTKKFKSSGIDFQYTKNNKDIYKFLNDYGSISNARKYARDIHNEYVNSGISPAKSESCTTVYKIFDAIDERLKEMN